MYGLYAGKKIIGYMSILKENNDLYELCNLSILPDYACDDFYNQMLDYANLTIKSFGDTKIKMINFDR